ncbi:MAG: AAA family ATPase [Gaiellaceae bacterium]
MSEQAHETTRIFVTGTCDGLQPLLEALAESEDLELLGASEHIAAAAPVLAGGHLQVVLHATRSSVLPINELAAIRELTRAPVILVCSSEASALLDEALEANVVDVLVMPQLIENVVFSIRRACHMSHRPEVPAGVEGKIVTVFSPKGGTGKTVIAANLAAALAHDEGKRALLLDLDLQFGDAAIMLGLEPDKTIFDLVVAPGELDADKLAGYTVKHACGLDILPAPLRPEDAELVTESKVGRLLEVARYSYEVIADARAALVPARSGAGGAEPRQRQGRHQAAPGRGSARERGLEVGACRPRRAAVGEPGRAGGGGRAGLRFLARSARAGEGALRRRATRSAPANRDQGVTRHGSS